MSLFLKLAILAHAIYALYGKGGQFVKIARSLGKSLLFLHTGCAPLVQHRA